MYEYRNTLIMSLVWSEVTSDSEFECPVTGGSLPIETYEEMFGGFLRTLDGRDMTSFVDFFFQRSPVNECRWEFKDEDAKLDFIDLCKEMALLPDLDLVHSGDWYLRLTKEDRKRELQKNRAPKPKLDTAAKQGKIAQQRLATLQKLEAELASVKDENKKNKIKEKIKKIKIFTEIK